MKRCKNVGYTLILFILVLSLVSADVLSINSGGSNSFIINPGAWIEAFFLGNALPSHSTPILNSSSGNNLTTDNLTCYNQSTYDPEGDPITNIYTWFKDGTPLAVLVMPFDRNVSLATEEAIKDYSGYGNHGTLKNFDFTSSSGWTDGKVGGAYIFDGTDDHIDCGNDSSLNPTKEITVSVWINPATIAPAQIMRIVQRGSGIWGIYVNTDGNLYFYVDTTDDGGSWQSSTYDLPSADSWYYVAGTYNSSNIKLYINASLEDSDPLVENIDQAGSAHLGIGAYIGPSEFFSGIIDDVRIYNYSLSALQINQIYQDTKDGYTSSRTIVNDETAKNDVWKCQVIPTDGVSEGMSLNSSSLTIENTAPNTTQVILNSSLGENTTNEDLHCYANITDIDGDDVYADYIWYKNSAVYLSGQSNSFTQSTLELIAILGSGNTSKGDHWICSVRGYDGVDYEDDWTNSTELVIKNTPPVVTLYSPEDGNVTINRTPTFFWNGSDEDGDDLTFAINITSYPTTDDTRYKEGIEEENYTPEYDLQYLSDNNYYYKWKVKAHDGSQWGNWSEEWQINISAYLAISAPVNLVEFGNLSLLESNDTTDDNPPPLIIQNDGNAFVNISINSTELWESISGESEYYRFKIDNITGEEGAFNWLSSITDWFNMSITGYVTGIAGLNYSDAKDSVETDIYVEVPPSEPPGSRNSTILFTESLGE